MDPVFGSMGLSPVVVSYCRLYLSRYLIFTIPILLMNNFTLYMIAAGKSALSMVCSQPPCTPATLMGSHR